MELQADEIRTIVGSKEAPIWIFAVIALDLARFVDLAEFRRQAGRLARAIKALPPQPGMEILLPGERGARADEERRRDGIPVPEAVLEELRNLMEEPA